jgi:type I restriction enzyme, S subunit
MTAHELHELADIRPGKTPSKSSYSSAGDVKIIKFRDVQEDGWINSRYEDTSGLVDLKPCSMLLTNAAHSLDHVGKKLGYVESIPKTIRRCCYVGELTAIGSKTGNQLSRWLYYYFQSEAGQREIAKCAEGAHLIPRWVRRIPVCVPDNGTREIHLAIFDLLDKSISTARCELYAANRLKTALMQQLFTKGIPGRHTQFKRLKGFSIPESWAIKPLYKLADVASGFTMGRDLSNHRTVIVPYVTVINVQNGFFNLSNVGSVKIKESELETGLLKPNDVLMTEGGDRDKLGRGCIWMGQIEICAYQNHIFRVRFRNDEYLPKLFHYLIQSRQSKRYFFSHAKQTSNLCTINSRELKKYPIGIPDPDEQQEIIEILNRCEDALEAITKKEESLLRLKKSLLQNLLTGKVRVNMEASE